MKKTLLIVLLPLSATFCNAQTDRNFFTAKNFDTEFLSYQPLQKAGVSDKDFKWALFVLSETKKELKNNIENYNVADYWNILSAFNVLQEDKEIIEMIFVKMANSDGACEYITSLKDKVSFDDEIPDLYNQYYDSCSGEQENEEEFDIDKYVSSNNLSNSLVLLIRDIDLKDQKHRGTTKETFRTKQPKLDQQNQILIDSLYRAHNKYIGRSLVGEKYEFVMWSVIQHSNPEMMERYLPVVHSAVRTGNLDVTPFKMLLDRLYGLKYGYQIFGSQIGFGFEMADEKTRSDIINKYGIE